MSKIEVNQISSQCGSTLTIGQSGDTVTLAAGATQSGFGRTGTVDWDTTAKTASFTAVSGTGYFVNTTSGAITVTLPASPSAGDIVAIADYARTFATNNVTVGRNSSNIQGVASDGTISTNGQSTTFVYVDGTKGWVPTEDQTTGMYGALFITATGGTVTTCGDYKIHTFTGPGTFCVSQIGNCAGGGNNVDYLVVAGGGAGGVGGNASGGGGGGGGLRFSSSTFTAPCTSAPRAGSALSVTASPYPITVGGGGTASTGQNVIGGSGSNSIFSTITSTGGGGGGSYGPGVYDGSPGGSGGGGAGDTVQGACATSSGGSGNTPPTSPSQGNPGGGGFDNSPNYPAGGGGGAGAAGTTQPNPGPAGPGGVGLQVNIDTNSYYYAGGGGGAVWEDTNGGNGGLGGGGGGAAREPTQSAGTGGGCAVNPGGAGTNSWPTCNSLGGNGGANTGGGSGGNNLAPGGATYSSGGSGIVIIRYKYQ